MRPQRHRLVILFFTLMVVNTGFGLILPILPYYATSLGASATSLGFLSATYASLQFIFAPLWGHVSDRIGRRPVILIGLLGFSASFLVFGLADRLWMLFLARSISGILSSATLPTALAYIADTTSPENRAGGMGLMGAAGGLGLILGPAAGGLLAGISIQAPFFLSAVLALLVALFAYLYLPETLAAPASKSSRRRSLLALAGALRGPSAFTLLLAALTSFGMAQLESTGALYAKARFGLGAVEMGAMFILIGALGFFSQVALVRRLINKFGERGAIQISLFGASFSFILFGLARTFAPAIVGVVCLGITTACLRPALNTLVSRQAAPTEQGSKLGTINSFYSLGMMFGPIAGGLIYDKLGMAWPFYTAALIHLAALLASGFLFKRRPDQGRV